MKMAILFIGMFGLFAQAFNGYVIPGILVASLSAISVAVVGFSLSAKSKLNMYLATLFSVSAAVGSAYDFYAYYSSSQVAGNYYGAWLWSVPLCICLAVHLIQLWKSRAIQSQPEQSKALGR